MAQINKSYYVIGIDVGGTNTDAVLLRMGHATGFRIGAGGMPGEIVNAVKTRTTADFSSGIQHAIVKVLAECNALNDSGSRVCEHDVCAVMIGTTVFLNAVLQSGIRSADDKEPSPLSPVACVRLCGRLTRASLPFSTFRPNLARQIESKTYFIDGGYEFNKKLVAELDESRILQVAEEIICDAKAAGRKQVSVAVTGVFSPLYRDQELKAEELITKVFRQSGLDLLCSVTLSHKIGQVGFIERENATILNASLRSFAAEKMKDLRQSILSLGLNCADRVFLTQNDGTLITLEEAIEFPVLTFSSGPVNSLRGASALTGLKDALVVDIGGTSADVAVLSNYFPRPAGTSIEICGVRTNFRMPDVFSIGLGGGSLVTVADSDDGGLVCSIGPASVGYKLRREAQCFGGERLTMTDVATASGAMQIDGADATKVRVTKEQVAAIEATMADMLERAIDKMKTDKQDIALILVGGGSALLRDGVKLAGVSQIHRPRHFAVANALGAAMAQVSVTVEEIHDLTGLDDAGKSKIQSGIEEKATRLLVAKGALPDGIEFTKDKVHLSYVLGECIRFVTKAVGYIDMASLARGMETRSGPSTIASLALLDDRIEPFVQRLIEPENPFGSFEFKPPKIITSNGRREWILSAEDIEFMAIGAGICACGGGGSTFLGRIEALKVIAEGHSMRVVDVDSFDPEDCAMFTACYGAPFAIFERISTTEKNAKCFEAIRQKLKVEKLAAVYCVEVGGLNSIVPLCVGARLGLPVLDCDMMGRAYPQLQMTTQFVYGESVVPCCLSGEYGDDYVLTEADVPNSDGKQCETILRTYATSHFGLDAAVTCPPVSMSRLRQIAIRNSMSRIWRLGRIIVQSRKSKTDTMQAIEQKENAKLLFIGKIIDLLRLTQGGYNKGVIEIAGLDSFAGRSISIDFMNENLVVKQADAAGNAQIIASVPDLISLVDMESFLPILTEELRYGLRVRLLVMPAHPLLCTPEGLKALGPEAFGYTHKWEDCSVNRSFGLDYQAPRSVFDEFPDSS